MQPTTVLGPALVGVMTLGAMPARAQSEVGVDLGLFSSYVWRGLSMTNKPVAQPAVYLSLPIGTASLTVGGWSSIDLGRYDDLADDISESGGSSGFNFAEFDPYAEISFPVGKAALTGGVIGYFYPNDTNAPGAGLMTSDANTWEIYGKAGFESPFSPELSLYFDLDKVDGAYIEGGVSYSVAASDRVSIDLGALAGFSAGQGVSDHPGESARFADDGFTHLDVSAGIPLTAGSVSITPVVHFVVGADDLTRITSPTDESDLKLWGGVSVGWSRTLGAMPEEEEGL